MGIGRGLPLGNSHGITAIFPSVKFNILFSLDTVLKESNAMKERQNNKRS